MNTFYIPIYIQPNQIISPIVSNYKV